jgi:hypothetical protein
MAVSEGVGRKLNPYVNLWQLTLTLVEGTGSRELGPTDPAARRARADRRGRRAPPASWPCERTRSTAIPIPVQPVTGGEARRDAAGDWRSRPPRAIALGACLRR